MERPHVTVAVPVKDRRERMLRCLESLLALDYPSYDVLVLDNESSDGTAEACRERANDAPVPVRVEVLAGSVGHLRNLAGELAGGDIIAFTDSDCMATPGWLQGLVSFFLDPGVGIVQGVTVPEPGVAQGRWAVTQDLREWTGRYECCNLGVRREALLNSEGFDEALFFGEDVAGGLAVERAGWRHAFAPTAVVHHDVTHPGFRWWLRRGYMYGNIAWLVRRFPEFRTRYLWGGLFFRRRDALLLASLAGLLLSRIDRRSLLFTLPYIWNRRPRGLHPFDLTVGRVQAILFDLVILAGMVRGSVRHRTLVL
jgi:cellulose synthase/poly-beta-1,6-N-acetylglucosamine synthase-like glycosyltransferase